MIDAPIVLRVVEKFLRPTGDFATGLFGDFLPVFGEFGGQVCTDRGGVTLGHQQGDRVGKSGGDETIACGVGCGVEKTFLGGAAGVAF